MAGNIIDGILDAPHLAGDTASNFRAIEGFLSELCGQLRYVLENLSGDNFNDTEFVEYANRMLRTDSLVSDSLYSDFGIIGNLTVSRLRTDYMRAARYRARDTRALRYLDIRDDRIVFYAAEYNGGTEALSTEDGARLYYADSMFTKMTTAVTPYPVIAYTYTEKPLFTMEIGADGKTLLLRYGNGGGLRFSGDGVELYAGDTSVKITPQGIFGLPGMGGAAVYPCEGEHFDETLEAASDGDLILKWEG